MVYENTIWCCTKYQQNIHLLSPERTNRNFYMLFISNQIQQLNGCHIFNDVIGFIYSVFFLFDMLYLYFRNDFCSCCYLHWIFTSFSTAFHITMNFQKNKTIFVQSQRIPVCICAPIYHLIALVQWFVMVSLCDNWFPNIKL